MSLTVAFPDFSANRVDRVGQPFLCTVQTGDLSPTLVHLRGDLDSSGAPRLQQALEQALAAVGTPPWLAVLDLRGVRSMDPSGAEVIVDAAARGSAGKGPADAATRACACRSRARAVRRLRCSGDCRSRPRPTTRLRAPTFRADGRRCMNETDAVRAVRSALQLDFWPPSVPLEITDADAGDRPSGVALPVDRPAR